MILDRVGAGMGAEFENMFAQPRRRGFEGSRRELIWGKFSWSTEFREETNGAPFQSSGILALKIVGFPGIGLTSTASENGVSIFGKDGPIIQFVFANSIDKISKTTNKCSQKQPSVILPLKTLTVTKFVHVRIVKWVKCRGLYNPCTRANKPSFNPLEM